MVIKFSQYCEFSEKDAMSQLYEKARKARIFLLKLGKTIYFLEDYIFLHAVEAILSLKSLHSFLHIPANSEKSCFFII